MLRSLVLAGAAIATGFRAPDPRPLLIQPSFSPDGREIAFASGGDIWSVPAAGGEARLLVSHAANDERPLYSPDGTRLAFWSNRTGGGDIYILTLATGALMRLTFDDGSETLDAWSRDGKWIYFSSSSRDVAGMNDVWRVNSGGGTPMQVAADRYASEYWAAPSPDGSTVAISARGTTSGQWWRNGHSHLDENEVWLVTPGDPPSYRQLSPAGGKHSWPMWALDGRTIYYMSDKNGAENIWKQAVDGNAAPAAVTKFTKGRVLWPQISLDGKSVVFERDFGIWTLDLASGQTKPVQVTLRGAGAGTAIEHLTVSNANDLSLSPDGRKIAFVMRGEIFAASAKDGGAAERVTATPGLERQVEWAPDSRRIAYSSDRNGPWNIYIYDFVTREETRATNGAASDVTPTWSHDGKFIAFARGGTELRLLDVAAGSDRLLVRGRFAYPPLLSDSPFSFSPDDKWLAYLNVDDRGYTNAFVIPASGGTPRQASFWSNSNGDCLRWSPDAKFLILCGSQRTEDGRILRVDLVPQPPKFREDAFRDLFPGDQRPDSAGSDAGSGRGGRGGRGGGGGGNAPASGGARGAAPSVEPVFEGIRNRASLIPAAVNASAAVISPDGKTLAIAGSAGGQSQLWAWSLDGSGNGPNALRQVTTSSGQKSHIQFSPDSREVWFTEGGRVTAVNVESRQQRTVNVTGELDVDFAREKMEVFGQAHSYLRDNFFDAKMNGVDWNVLGATYRERIESAQTPDEMRRLLQLMIGELNASHMGASGGGGGGGGRGGGVGRIGARFDRVAYETGGRLKITEIIPQSPLALTDSVAVGDVIASVDGTPITANTSLDDLLEYKTGKKVVLGVAPASGGAVRQVAVQPISSAAEKQLLYRAWVESRRAYVAKASNGRLGYVHMYDMGQGSLDQLYVDLDAENQSREGVVVDVRNNNGGFVQPYAIDVLARRGYLTMQGRTEAEMPARAQVGQRALERPTVLVTNQHSLSDAEDFTEGYRSLGLGKVVGEPTAGWIVFTWNVNLIDGTTLRLPRQRMRGSDGKDMEMNPRKVDVPVTRPVGEWYTGRDSQLAEAVKQLLAQIDGAKR